MSAQELFILYDLRGWIVSFCTVSIPSMSSSWSNTWHRSITTLSWIFCHKWALKIWMSEIFSVGILPCMKIPVRSSCTWKPTYTWNTQHNTQHCNTNKKSLKRKTRCGYRGYFLDKNLTQNVVFYGKLVFNCPRGLRATNQPWEMRGTDDVTNNYSITAASTILNINNRSSSPFLIFSCSFDVSFPLKKYIT